MQNPCQARFSNFCDFDESGDSIDSTFYGVCADFVDSRVFRVFIEFVEFVESSESSDFAVFADSSESVDFDVFDVFDVFIEFVEFVVSGILPAAAPPVIT